MTLDAVSGTRPIMHKPARSRRRLALLALALLAATGTAPSAYEWWTEGRFVESTDDAYIGGNVTPISPHVGGFIARVMVADNQSVKAGQMLIQLDPRDYQAALDNTKAMVAARTASLQAFRARYSLQQATLRQQDAEVAAKSAQLAFTNEDAKRYRALAATGAGTGQDAQRSASLDKQAQATFAAANAALEAGRQQLAVLTAQIAEAEAELAQAQSDLRTAELNLSYTQIRAPVDGYVGNRSAQVGAYVNAGTYLISVIPVEGLWVDANFKEDQLTSMVNGNQATIVVDVLPGHVFHGHVASIAPGTGAIFSVIPAENATGNFTKIVQRVPVRVALDAGDAGLRMLRPGLSSTARIDTRAKLLVGDDGVVAGGNSLSSVQ